MKPELVKGSLLQDIVRNGLLAVRGAIEEPAGPLRFPHARAESGSRTHVPEAVPKRSSSVSI